MSRGRAIAAVVLVAACGPIVPLAPELFDGGAPEADAPDSGSPEVGPPDASFSPSQTPLLSYAPACPSPRSPSCAAGTEIQALERFGGALFAGTSNWMETNPAIWPRWPAQVLALDAQSGAWEPTARLPDSQQICGAGVAAPWEQVNDLLSATFDGVPYLFAATNADEVCPGAQGTVFYRNPQGEWVDTGLSTILSAHYAGFESEVRYVVAHSDNTGSCPASAPCLFALVDPRNNGSVGSSGVWRGRSDPACGLICWDAHPEISFDGVSHPSAMRLVSAYDAGADRGLYVGTQDASAALVKRNTNTGAWVTIWQGAESAIRGIVSWRNPATQVESVWWVGNDDGQIYRTDAAGPATVLEARLVDLNPTHDFVDPKRCDGFYGYQLHLHERWLGDPNPIIVVASQGCDRARLFFRHVSDACPTWRMLELPSLANDPATPRVNEASIRWLETSPFDHRDLFFGTTDMNSGAGSLTARIYRLVNPWLGTCPP